LGIINDILDFSKREKGKLRIEREETDLREILDEVSNQFSYNLGDKKI